MKPCIKDLTLHPLSDIVDRSVSLEKANNCNDPTTAKKSNVSKPVKVDEFEQFLGLNVDEDGSINQSLSNVHGGDKSTTFPELTSRIKTLEDAVDVLKERTSGDGVKFRDFSFQSPEELNTWVKEHVKGSRFGIFLDGVSIWEYFFLEHKNMDDVLSSYSSTKRIGFPLIHKRKVAASFQNVLPSTLGRGIDTATYLPSLPNACTFTPPWL